MVLGILGAAGGLLGGLGGLFGGGGGGGGQPAPVDFYAQYGAQAAAANSPLTAAMQSLATLQGAQAGALGLEGSTLSSGQLSVLKEALERSQSATGLQAAESLGLTGANIDLGKQVGQARLATELQGPQFTAQAGQAALQGENLLAQQLGTTNIGLQAAQELARTSVAEMQAKNQALVRGDLARIEGQTMGDLQRTQAQTEAQLALKRFGQQAALAGQRFLA